MKNRVWFTLLIRALGVWLMASHAGTLFWAGTRIAEHIYQSITVTSEVTFGQLLWDLISMLGSVVTFAIGAYLFFDGRWIINRCLREAEAAEDGNAS